jgi:integrase
MFGNILYICGMRKKVVLKIPKPRFDLHLPRADGRYSCRMRINYQYQGKHVSVQFGTGFNVDPKHWDKKAARLRHVRGREDYVEQNRQLDTLANIAVAIFREADGEIAPKDFLKELHYRTGNRQRPGSDRPAKMPTASNLFEFIEQFIEQQQRKADAKRDTWKKFPTAYNHLKDFAADQGKKTLQFDDIDWKFRAEFVEWLYLPPRRLSINTAAKILKNVMQFMRESARLGLHGNRVYEDKGFALRTVKTKNKIRLTFAELRTIAALDLSANARLDRVRDLLIVGSYSGLRFSDWSKVKREQITVEPDGTELLEITTQKTTDHLFIPLLPELKAVLVKYDFKLPKISVQKFDEYVKELLELAIPDAKFMRIYSEGGQVLDEYTEKYKHAGSHCARRSFASNFFEIGIPAAILMQITGHSTERQFFEYIDLDRRSIARQFAREAAKKMATGGHDARSD